ncbi:unnamed protein product [Vitrella brassicaformis CCMP3155]|uniref:Uncharacterized protein n=1 Tax=Vitrella brassicaformis (strain CCMP3155) TaxID=1169540 RepID=A0A0G4GXW4_VITBC|nr:unnamed protein product [Vitrella brassicaformis CCMP3155]|eukprot:CEM35969.1 unnamed protein product [Vitrella brassicaformis CCMP3155]
MRVKEHKADASAPPEKYTLTVRVAGPRQLGLDLAFRIHVDHHATQGGLPAPLCALRDFLQTLASSKAIDPREVEDARDPERRIKEWHWTIVKETEALERKLKEADDVIRKKESKEKAMQDMLASFHKEIASLRSQLTRSRRSSSRGLSRAGSEADSPTHAERVTFFDAEKYITDDLVNQLLAQKKDEMQAKFDREMTMQLQRFHALKENYVSKCFRLRSNQVYLHRLKGKLGIRDNEDLVAKLGELDQSEIWHILQTMENELVQIDDKCRQTTGKEPLKRLASFNPVNDLRLELLGPNFDITKVKHKRKSDAFQHFMQSLANNDVERKDAASQTDAALLLHMSRVMGAFQKAKNRSSTYELIEMEHTGMQTDLSLVEIDLLIAHANQSLARERFKPASDTPMAELPMVISKISSPGLRQMEGDMKGASLPEIEAVMEKLDTYETAAKNQFQRVMELKRHQCTKLHEALLEKTKSLGASDHGEESAEMRRHEKLIERLELSMQSSAYSTGTPAMLTPRLDRRKKKKTLQASVQTDPYAAPEQRSLVPVPAPQKSNEAPVLKCPGFPVELGITPFLKLRLDPTLQEREDSLRDQSTASRDEAGKSTALSTVALHCSLITSSSSAKSDDSGELAVESIQRGKRRAESPAEPPPLRYSSGGSPSTLSPREKTELFLNTERTRRIAPLSQRFVPPVLPVIGESFGEARPLRPHTRDTRITGVARRAPVHHQVDRPQTTTQNVSHCSDIQEEAQQESSIEHERDSPEMSFRGQTEGDYSV